MVPAGGDPVRTRLCPISQTSEGNPLPRPQPVPHKGSTPRVTLTLLTTSHPEGRAGPQGPAQELTGHKR